MFNLPVVFLIFGLTWRKRRELLCKR